MSENFAYSHMSKPGRSRTGYVGESAPGVETRISPEGEIQIKSPATMMGYYKDEEKTRETFTEDGFLKTGDMGEIDRDGTLRITGRVKDLFKTSKGKYVVPVPIENRFNHPKAEVVCVAGANQPQPCLMVLLSEDARDQLEAGGDRAELEQELAQQLDAVNAECEAHEKLAFVVVVKEPWTMENGMLTPTMKIKRNVIEDFYTRKMDDWFGQKKKVVWEF